MEEELDLERSRRSSLHHNTDTNTYDESQSSDEDQMWENAMERGGMNTQGNGSLSSANVNFFDFTFNHINDIFKPIGSDNEFGFVGHVTGLYGVDLACTGLCCKQS